MTAFQPSELLFTGILIVAGIFAYAIVLRWLMVIVPAILLVGFAFEPDVQLRFTLTLLGWLAVLYLLPACRATIRMRVSVNQDETRRSCRSVGRA
jgi:hypothetical protein